jgi:hypothetical protein
LRQNPFSPKNKIPIFVISVNYHFARHCGAMRKCALCDIQKNKGIKFAKPYCNFLIKVQGRNIHCFVTRLKPVVGVITMGLDNILVENKGAYKITVKWATEW